MPRRADVRTRPSNPDTSRARRRRRALGACRSRSVARPRVFAHDPIAEPCPVQVVARAALADQLATPAVCNMLVLRSAGTCPTVSATCPHPREHSRGSRFRLGTKRGCALSAVGPVRTLAVTERHARDRRTSGNGTLATLRAAAGSVAWCRPIVEALRTACSGTRRCRSGIERRRGGGPRVLRALLRGELRCHAASHTHARERTENSNEQEHECRSWRSTRRPNGTPRFSRRSTPCTSQRSPTLSPG